MTLDLNQAVHNNFIEKVSYVARAVPSMVVVDYDNFISVDCGLPSDTFNIIVARNLLATEQLLTEGVGHFMKKRWPMALWYWEDADDAHKMKVLTEFGLAHTETHVAMAADLAQARLTVPVLEGLVIRQVADIEDLQQYGSVMSALFGASAEAQQVAAYYNVLAQYPVDRFPALRSYTGIYHGKVAAIGCLFIGHDTIGIYDIVTREEFRGVGIGSAMFAHLIETAKSFGSRYAVLQASPDGIGIYRRAGFMSVGTVHTFENRKMLETAQPSVQQRKVLDLGC